MSRLRLATVWLSGCSGCHMSILNLHETLLALLEQCELVYSPLMDIKEFPLQVDCVLVEGAVANRENRELAQVIRAQSRFVVSLGDCAVNGNISALRNPLGKSASMTNIHAAGVKPEELPDLEARVMPLHQVIRVDAFIPGCPPKAEDIGAIVKKLLSIR